MYMPCIYPEFISIGNYSNKKIKNLTISIAAVKSIKSPRVVCNICNLSSNSFNAMYLFRRIYLFVHAPRKVFGETRQDSNPFSKGIAICCEIMITMISTKSFFFRYVGTFNSSRQQLLLLQHDGFLNDV